MRCSSLLIASIFSLACASAEEPTTAGPGAGGNGAEGSAGSWAGGGGSGSTIAAPDAGGGAAGNAGACAVDVLEAELVKRPLDLVIYLDSSKSMGNALAAIKNSFDQSFSSAMVASGVDYRVIMIAATPFVTSPVDPSRYFFYPRGTGSGDLPAAFLSTYVVGPGGGKEPLLGWSQWARPNAFKALVALTDSGSGPTLSGAQFESQLYDVKKLPGFGSVSDRNYRFHFVSGFVNNGAPSVPWQPPDPIVNAAKCAATGGLGQGLSRLSGGLRFSMCDYAAYPQMFDALAQSEIELTPIECTFAIPTPPDGKTVDPNTIEIVFKGGGIQATIGQVHDESECTSGGFYVVGDEIHLCPSTCETVQAQDNAKLSVSYGCPTSFVPN